MGSLQGRVAIITGAAGGLGREYARLFAREGAALVLNDLPGPHVGLGESPLCALVREVEELGGEAVAHSGDIGDETTAVEMVAQAVDVFGHVDVLVNNAGTFSEGFLEESAAADWDLLSRVHLRAVFLTTRAAASHWRSRREANEDVHASVINTTSRSALNAIAGHGAYAAAKGGVIVFSQVAAKELEAYGVRVNCIAPFARTAMTRKIKILADSLSEEPRPGVLDPLDPAHVAPIIAYLATKDCPITGQVLFCHGGVVQRYEPWSPAEVIRSNGAWTIAELAERFSALIKPCDPA
jgi:NAD(P)-dependent dehydrogenase (short-subunit alcohol dehydrogenase family)